jgi:hypothetical protein
MTICPLAIATGCKKCPIFNLCPAKEIIGDFKKEPIQIKKPAAKKGPNRKLSQQS